MYVFFDWFEFSLERQCSNGLRRSWFTQIVVHASDQFEESLPCCVEWILMLLSCASVILHCMWVCVCLQTGFTHSMNLTYSMFAQLMQRTYEGNNNIRGECLVSLSCIINSQSQHVLCLWRLLTACNHEANSNPLKHWHCFDSYDHVNDVPECYLLSVMLLALWPWLLHVLWLSEPLFFNTRRHKYCHAMLDFL